MNGLEFIQSQPGLMAALVSEAWKENFDARSLQKAPEYTSASRLLAFEIEILEDDYFFVSGSLAGNSSRAYKTTVHFEGDGPDQWLLGTDCSCPIGIRCKHAAALLFHLSSLLRNPPTESTAPSGLNRSLQNWLRDLAEAPSAQKSPGKPDKRFLAYCIRPPYESTAPPELVLHIGRWLKNGDFRIDLGSNANADPLNPPKYLQREDLIPCTLFRQQQRYSYAPRARPLAGADGHALLQEILKTERLFSLLDDGEAIPVRPAPALPAKPGWQPSSDGSATPSLGLPPDALIIPTSPLLVLMPPAGDSHATLHPVKSGSVPDPLLAVWLEGPTVPATQIAEVSSRFVELPEPLPVPTKVETKTLPKTKPVPRLTLHRKNPFAHRGLHLSGQPEPIVAQVAFDYHGHRVVPDLDRYDRKLDPLRIFEDETVLTIPRHKTGELACLNVLLNELGLQPASHFDPLGPDGIGCVLPDAEPRDWDREWARHMATTLPSLESQGWVITIDTSAHIEVHAIGPDNLDTGLGEVPEHGIDWFQFEASYLTPEGAKQSLLPLLSAYLEVIDPAAIDESLATVSDDDHTILKDPDTGHFVSIDTRRLLTLVKSIHDLFGYQSPADPLHRLQAADLADSLELDSSDTLRSLAALGRNLKSITSLPKPRLPKRITATLRDYQLDGFHWMQFLARHELHGILADDMGLGKTLQALSHIQSEVSGRRTQKRPSLVVAPTSVVGNWTNEARKFAPHLKVLVLHGPERKDQFHHISKYHLVLTSYALLPRDFEHLRKHEFHLLILDEAQYIKNPASKISQLACQLSAAHRLSLSGTPLENHLGELWSQMRFLMPGLLGSSEHFGKTFRSPIEKHHDRQAQAGLNRRVAPLILRRTKEDVATELPPKTEIIHTIPLHKKQVDLYETVRAAMDKRVRDIIADKGLAKSHIIVLDALLKLRQICCHPQLLKLKAASKVRESSKLEFLTTDLLPTLLEEGRRILLFSTFTSMLALIEQHLDKNKIPFAKITGSTTKRQAQIDRFQNGDVPVFLISLKAGGTGLNLTAADTVIHYDPWWNPAAENQATDRAHRIGQTKPVFVHKLICEGTIEQRIQELQAKKAALVEALLTDDTNRLKIDQSTLNNLLAPLSPE